MQHTSISVAIANRIPRNTLFNTSPSLRIVRFLKEEILFAPFKSVLLPTFWLTSPSNNTETAN